MMSGMIDLHAHILPGIDDGACSMAESLRMAAAYLSGGTDTVVATPHFIQGGFEPEPAAIIAGVAALKQNLAAQGSGLVLLPGMEVEMCFEVPELLRQGKLLTINAGGKYLLLELPFTSIPPCTRQVIYQLGLMGITTLLAHPERNREISRRPVLVDELVQAGALTQINGGSFLGHFGPEVKRAAYELLHKGHVHLVAGDAHQAAGGRGPCQDLVKPLLIENVGQLDADLLLCQNPGAVINGGQVSRLAARQGRKRMAGFFGRLFHYQKV